MITLGLVYVGRPADPQASVPAGARAGDLRLQTCTFDTGAKHLAADCGTLVVPENRRRPPSRLIGLPVVRIRATGSRPAEPIFQLSGGPGQTNMTFPTADRLTDHHDVVLVGYRGVDGSSVLNCPEVTSALRKSAELVSDASYRRYGRAFAACAHRLAGQGVDLAGYSQPEQVEDMEAARQALGYRQVDLISYSAGTRTAMIYAWRHPDAVKRSVMIGVNPPGHYLWDPALTDAQLDHYGELCSQDERCAARTGDLTTAMRATSAHMPSRWGFLPIEPGNVRAGTFLGLFNTTPSAAPLNAPTMIDAWQAAAAGDPSGLWAVSTLMKLFMPTAFTWGEFAGAGMIDADAVDAYYAAGGDHGSILRNAGSDLLWGGGQLAKAWPVSPDYNGYRRMRPTDVETLLIGGTVDFSTPAQAAETEALPAMPNGHQVVLAEYGHVPDFWSYQPDAGKQLVTAFFDRGQVDTSGFRVQKANFDAGALTMPAMAKILLGALLGGALFAVAMLGWMALRVRRRGGFGRTASAWLRSAAAVPVGLGGWFLAVLIAMTGWPALFIGSPAVVVPSTGIAVGLCVHLARTRRDWTRRLGYASLFVAVTGALLGGWAAGHAADGLTGALTTLVGAVLGGNLALLTMDLVRDRRMPRPIDAPPIPAATVGAV
ncbi:alpha/beta hydrolase [Actinoplanes sp. KI2]|uniref:alpha/beta hydrolase n=1 Tax=Actinoplanes sp. KI2 TaxID=2983315 RepID=UPI0021D5D876|nr:alpha/beta hydrolase [Actinoplanes sp. KI2]MCU7729534.1 alpha/beta hydrolase [Actinoplanes sp. KI2]